MLRNLVTCLVALSVVMLSAAVASAAYTPVTDLGIPYNRAYSAAYDFNSKGEVAVQGTTDSSSIGAYVWYNGTYTDLGSLGYDYAYPRGIDEDGTVVGMARTSSSTSSGLAFKWTPTGNMVPLGTLGGTQSRADFINNGDIVGSSQTTGSSIYTAFVIYSGSSTMTPIGTLYTGKNCYAYKINDSRHVIGMSYDSTGVQRGWFYDGTNPIESIGVLPGYSTSMAYGMNNSDVVVGYSNKSGDMQAIYWTKAGGIVGLGYLDDTQLYSSAVEINNLGQIIGKARINLGTAEKPIIEDHAVIWNNGVIKDLNDYVDPFSGWVLQQATMIDDNGTIVGHGLKDGVQHGFMMTLPPVPEPSTLVLLATGLLGLLAYAWRRLK